MSEDVAGQDAHERPALLLLEDLRSAASAGYDEWRVQDPMTGAYCIAYSWPDVLHPEREARAWLADQQARFPKGRYTDYVVACVRVVPKKDQLLTQAAAALQALSRDAERYRFIRDADKSDGLIPELGLYAMESLDDYVDAAMAEYALLHGAK